MSPPPLSENHSLKRWEDADGVSHSQRTACASSTHGLNCFGELHHRQEFSPIRKGMDVSSKYLLEGTIGEFGLTICFRMIRRGYLQSRSESFEHGTTELSCEPRVPIGHEFTWKPMKEKTVSIKAREYVHALIDSGTAAGCTILLNLSILTRIPVFL